MKYQPKHMRDERGSGSANDSDSKSLPPTEDQTSTPIERPHELPDTAHPLGIPVPDPGDGGEYVPSPGKGSIDHIAPNGAVIRNPWSEQPEIKPDYAYTDEQEDQNLLIM